MQLFVRNLDGSSASFTTSSLADLAGQISSRFDLDPSSTRLSYGSRAVPSSGSFADLAIPNYATLDLSLRLVGGGPKKRCAYVFAAKPAGSTPIASTSATPAPAEVSASEQTASTSTAVEGQEAEKNEEEAAAAPIAAEVQVQEPVVERCGSAALRMVGECPRCEKNYCGAHRLPEDHACPAMAGFRKAAFDENRNKLTKEATIVSKISAF